jgi:ATP-dependent Clp protease ATP-binding subunit ClpC
MPNRNFPLLRWTDPSGNHTAVLAGCFDATAAHAPSIKEAMQQLKDILLWRLENEPWMADPDLLEPALLEVKVEIQPQYSGEDRIIPCPETLWIRMPCVTGVQENGLRVCAVPMLDIRFNYHDEGGLKSLAAHYIKDAMQGLSPLELAGRLPPRDCVLDEISLPDEGRRIRRKLPADRPELKALFSVADPLLHSAGRKRTAPAAHGREALSCALARILEQETASVLLVGASGVGKSTLIFDAVKKMSRNKKRAGDGDGDDDAGMDSYRYWRGNAGRMIAGMQYLGEWEERCEAFIEQLNAIDGVFCAESLLDLVRVGGQGPGDGVAAFLLLYLQRGELRMIAEATPGEVEACRRLMPGLLDMFQVLPVPDFSDAEAVEVLSRIAGSHATASRREIEPAVAPLVHRLFKRFLPDAAFPGSAANFVRSLCERTAGHKSVQKGAITVQDAMALFIKQTGLPELFLRDEMPLEMEQVRRTFDALIVGQADATLAAARLTAKIKSGLTDPGRPFGVLLFCGPTGVGKTALAKALAEFCFGADGAKDRLRTPDLMEFV